MNPIYQCFVKFEENRNSPGRGPFSFPSPQDRQGFVQREDVYWYHFAEEDDWHLWKRGGAWAATRTTGPEDRVPDPPVITEEDRL